MKSLISSLCLCLLISPLMAQVEVESVKINGHIPIFTSLEKIRGVLEIDSITTIPDIMDMSEADSLVYIGKSYFECYLPANRCEISVLIFDTQITSLRIASVELTRGMPIEKVQQLLPQECSELRPIKIYGEEEAYEFCTIPLVLHDGSLFDQSLLLFFQNRKLTRIDF